MKYTVSYTKRSFFKNKIDIKTVDKNGAETISGSYKKNVAPGSIIKWRLKFNGASMKFPLNIDQTALNQMVSDIQLFDKNGSEIKTANLRNPADPFLTHDSLVCTFEGGSKILDDENPLDRFFLRCFKNDRDFYFVDDDTDKSLGKSAVVKFTVTKAGHENKETSKGIDEGLEAAALLKDMTFERQVQILKSFGVNMNNPDPIIVKNTLYTKISDKKDSLYEGKRNIEKFLELAKSTSSELNLRDLITEAYGKGIIIKKPGNKYHWGELFLGRNLDTVFQYLSDPENSDVKEDIIKLTNKK